MLTRRRDSKGHRQRSLAQAITAQLGSAGLSRRKFLVASGVTTAGAAALAGLPSGRVRAVEAKAPASEGITRKKTICPFCLTLLIAQQR